MFYGWRIVFVTFLSLFISVGFGFYSYGAFFLAIAGEFGGSRFLVGLGMSIWVTMTGLFAPFLGRALDRGRVRRIMITGVLAVSFGFVLLSRVQALWQFYLVLGTFIAVGGAMVGGLPASALVSNWFVKRRGMALGIATMGISLSGMVMAPCATLLIERLGWRHTFLVYGAVTLTVVLPAVWLWIVNRPEDLGLRPDGERGMADERAVVEPVVPLAPGDQTDHAAPPASGSMGILGEPNFWIIALVIALNFCANGALLSHIINHAKDLGFEAQRAALVLSAAAGMGVLGKVLFGWITDRIDKRVALWIATGFQTLAMLFLLRVESYPFVLLAGGIFGLGMGGLVPLWGALIGASFGRRVFGRAMGLMSPVMLPLQILGTPFAGWVFDRYGTYAPAFKVFIGLYILATGLLFLLRLPAVEPGQEGWSAASEPVPE